MYKLYVDRPEDFICEVSVKNASLKGSLARLVLESTDGINFIFNGKIEGEKCIIPIRRLKGYLDENTKGNMHLEIIVEDTYFRPWQSDFVVEEHTSVKVKVNDTKVSSKPILEVKVPETKKNIKEIKNKGVYVPLKELTEIFNRFKINKHSILHRKNDFRAIIKEYFDANPEFKKNKDIILEGLKHFLR